jgi:hypothetical protein
MTTATTEQRKTCADLIGSELADREQQLADLYEKMNGEDEEQADQASEEVHEMAYGISVYSVAKVIWSGGGPADWIEITFDKYDLIKVEYIYQDWYDGARVAVEEDSAVWRYAEEMLEGLNA